MFANLSGCRFTPQPISICAWVKAITAEHFRAGYVSELHEGAQGAALQEIVQPAIEPCRSAAQEETQRLGQCSEFVHWRKRRDENVAHLESLAQEFKQPALQQKPVADGDS